MKMLITVAILSLSLNVWSQPTPDMVFLSCQQAVTNLKQDRFAIQVYVSPKSAIGQAIIIKNETVVKTLKVSAAGNGDTFATTSGVGMELSVDAENGNSGTLEITLDKKEKKKLIQFDEEECTHIPKNWPA